MSNTLLHTGRLVVVTCWCGIGHAIPESLDRMIDEGKQDGHCPLGHVYVRRGETEAQRLKEEKAALERRLSAERDTARRLRDNLESERRSAAAVRGHLTRARKRIAAGVCPAPGCKRSGFDDIAAHLHTVHPDWVADHEEVLV